MNIYSELELRILLQELLAQRRVGQKVTVMDYSTSVETVYTSRNACAKALGVHQSYIVEGRLLKKGKYLITQVGPIALSMKTSNTDHLYYASKPPFQQLRFRRYLIVKKIIVPIYKNTPKLVIFS